MTSDAAPFWSLTSLHFVIGYAAWTYVAGIPTAAFIRRYDAWATGRGWGPGRVAFVMALGTSVSITAVVLLDFP